MSKADPFVGRGPAAARATVRHGLALIGLLAALAPSRANADVVTPEQALRALGSRWRVEVGATTQGPALASAEAALLGRGHNVIRFELDAAEPLVTGDGGRALLNQTQGVTEASPSSGSAAGSGGR